jgi:hypothetical protein
MSRVPVRVRTYSGYRGEQRPTAFEHEGRSFVVEEILEEAVELRAGRVWRRFRIRADGRLFTLRREEHEGVWLLESEE